MHIKILIINVFVLFLIIYRDTLCNNTNLLINYYNYLALYMYKKKYRCDLFLKHPTLVIKKNSPYATFSKLKLIYFFSLYLLFIAYLIKKVYKRFPSFLLWLKKQSSRHKNIMNLKTFFLPSN